MTVALDDTRSAESRMPTAAPGWLLPNIHRELFGRERERRAYPFDLDAVLPWWSAIRELGTRYAGQAHKRALGSQPEDD